VSLDDFTARLATTSIPWHMARLLSWILAVHALVTGWDYLHTPESAVAAKSLKIVIELADLHTWGAAFLAGGATLILGLIVRRHAAVWLGHLLCAAMYCMFSIATAQAVWEYSRTDVADQQGSIWRGVTQALVITALHAILCYVRGPVPRKGDEQ